MKDPLLKVALVFALTSSYLHAEGVGLDSSYGEVVENKMQESAKSEQELSDLAIQAMDESYTALHSALESLRTAYKTAKITTSVADLAWTGTYDCSNYKNNADGIPEYNYADYSTHWGDGVKPTLDGVRTITISTDSVSGLSSADGWSSTATCTLYSLQFDHF